MISLTSVVYIVMLLLKFTGAVNMTWWSMMGKEVLFLKVWV